MPAPQTTPATQQFAERAAPFFVLGTALFMAAALWGRVGEVLADFGNELYVAWQLSLGKVLYRDIDYRFGPLSTYANALYMRIFGASVQTILIANFVVFLLVGILLYRLLIRISDRLTAGAAMIVFIIVFAFVAGGGPTDFNFLTPYRHGATYGILFSLAAVSFVGNFAARGRIASSILAGVFCGLSLLTKPEIFIACAAAVGLGLVAASLILRRAMVRAVLAAGVGFGAVALIALGALAHQMPLSQAVAGLLSGLQSVSNKELLGNEYYRWGMGTDKPVVNLEWAVASAGFHAAFIGLLYGAAFWLRRNQPVALTIAGLFGGGIGAFLFFDHQHETASWNLVTRGLPIAMALLVVLSAIKIRQSIRGGAAVPARVLIFTFAVLALGLLAKMILNVRLFHYGFVLAMPTAMLAVVSLLYLIPRRIDSRGGYGNSFRVASAAMLLGMVGYFVDLTDSYADRRTATANFVMGGSLQLTPVCSAAADLIKRISLEIPENKSLAVFPNAAGINFAAGRSSSIAFTACDDVQLVMVGENQVLSALRAAPPDYVVVIVYGETNWSGGAPRYFGRDYGKSIYQWIAANYVSVDTFPDAAAAPYIERMTLLRRKAEGKTPVLGYGAAN